MESAVDVLQLLTRGNVSLLCWTVLLWWAPGMALAAALGVRGWLVVASAPTITFGMVAVASAAIPLLGFTWTPMSGLATAACMVALGLMVAWRAHPGALPWSPWSRRGTFAVVSGGSIGAGLGVLVTFRATRGLQALPEHHDPPFHANAIRWIAESGDPRPSALAWISQETPQNYYYPNTYHVLESVAYSTTGNSVPMVMNASLVVLVSLVVPLGVVAVVRGAGGSARLAASAAVFSTSYQLFPYDMLGASQIIPYAIAIGALGGFLGLFLAAVNSGSVALGVLTSLSAVGVAGVHNSAAFVAVIFVVCYLVQTFVFLDRQRAWTCVTRTVVISAGAGLLGFPSVAGAVSASSKVVGTSVLPETETPSQALGEALFLGHNAWWPQMSLALLAITGSYLMFGSRTWRWLVAAQAVLIGLTMITQTLPYPWAKLISAPWWNDRERLYAALGLGIAVAAGYALQAASTRVAEGVSPAVTAVSNRFAAADLKSPARAGIVALVFVSLYLVMTHGYVPRDTERMGVGYGHDPVSVPHQDGMVALRHTIAPGEKVINDINDGSVWMYALSGVRPMFSHYDSHISRDQKMVLDGLNRFDHDKSVRQAVTRLGAHYVVVRAKKGRDEPVSQGMSKLNQVRALTLVWSNPGLHVYRISPPAA